MPPTRELTGPIWDRAVALEIGAFNSQADLLHFAMLLEAMPQFGRIDLIEAEPGSALFVVRAASADSLAAAVARMPGYHISAEAVGNSVSARIEPPTSRAVQVVMPIPRGMQPAPTVRRRDAAPWLRALLVAAVGGAIALAVFFGAANHLEAPDVVVRPTPPIATPTVQPTVVVPPRPTPTPVLPTATPTATPETTPTAVATVAPPVLLSGPVSGTFAGTLGTVRALNGCAWDTPFEADMNMTMDRAANGDISGQATLAMTLRYVVTTTPAGATCNPSVVSTSASGLVGGNGERVTAVLTGDRDLFVSFAGTATENAVRGSATVRRTIGTVSTRGNSNETRSASIPDITFTAN